MASIGSGGEHLTPEERDLLQRLGAAVVAQWGSLPVGVQVVLRDQALAVFGHPDPASLGVAIDRMLEIAAQRRRL